MVNFRVHDLREGDLTADLEIAKNDALARAGEAVNELTALGFDYELVEPVRAAIRGGSHLSAEPQSDEYVLFVKMFDHAVDRLGHIAEELDGLAQSTATAIAEIAAEGDRIDRLQTDNRAMLDDLLNRS